MLLDALTIRTLLADVDDAAVAALIAASEVCTFARGETVFEAGDEPTGIYLIDAGKVKLTWRPSDIELAEDVLQVLGPGHVFGEVSICDPCPRTGTVVTLTPCELHHLPLPDAERLLSEHACLARVLLHHLARRLRLGHTARIVFAHSDVPGRVAFAILVLAKRFGETYPDGSIHIHHDITQSELASMIGASREAVNKALSDFATRRWIGLGTKSLVVLNHPRLRTRVGGLSQLSTV